MLASYTPLSEMAETQEQSAATGIIYGLALGLRVLLRPSALLERRDLVAHTLCGLFGVVLGALDMIGTMTMALTIDAAGPTSDNAGGIARRVDCLGTCVC